MGVVGDVVRDRRGLRFKAGEAIEIQREQRVEIRHGPRQQRARLGPRPDQRAIVLDQPLQRFPGKVQPVELGIAMLQRRDDPQRLGVVVEAAISRHLPVEGPLAGMAEGRVAEIMDQRDGLGEILVEPQSPGEGAGDLRHLDRVGQAGAKMIALVGDENLGLVLQPAKGGGMDDPVAIALERRAGAAGGLGIEAAAGFLGLHGVGRAGDAAHPDPRECRVACSLGFIHRETIRPD